MPDKEIVGKATDTFARLICLLIFCAMLACAYLSYATWGKDLRAYGFGLLAIAFLVIATIAPASTRAGVIGFVPWV